MENYKLPADILPNVANKRVVIFSLPGAFTPIWSTYQLPGFEQNYNEFKSRGIDEIYCLPINDAFFMNCWAKDQGIKNVKVIPDGSAVFTSGMGMYVTKDNLGFGGRSPRSAVIAENGRIVKRFIEPGMRDNANDDPYGEPSPENILNWIKTNPFAS